MNEHAGVLAVDSVTAKYGRHREIQRALNRRLTTTLPRAALKECARSLGLWEAGTLAFEEEDDVAVLMDFAIYDKLTAYLIRIALADPDDVKQALPE